MKTNAVPCAIKKSGGVLKDLGKEYPVILPAHVMQGKAVEEYLLNGENLAPVAYRGTMAAVPRMLATYLSLGHPVKLEGLGTFFITMKGDVVTKPNGRKELKNEMVDKITFHPCKAFLNELRKNTKFCLLQNGAEDEDSSGD